MKLKNYLWGFTVLLVAVCCSVMISSCGSDDDNDRGEFGNTEFDNSSIVGKWELSRVLLVSGGQEREVNVSKNSSDDEWGYEIYTFAADGKCMCETFVDGVLDPNYGTYSYNENTHKISISETVAFTVQSLTSKSLILTASYEGDAFIAIYKRIGEGVIEVNPGPSGTDKTNYPGDLDTFTSSVVTGTWKQTWEYRIVLVDGEITSEVGKASSESTITMNADNTCSLKVTGEGTVNGQYTYDSSNRIITFFMPGEDDMTFVIRVLTNEYCVLERVEGDGNHMASVTMTFKRS